MSAPIVPGPWEATGMSERGAYFKVRGTIAGGKWEICNVPFTVDRNGKTFYGVDEAKALAERIANLPVVERRSETLAVLLIQLRGALQELLAVPVGENAKAKAVKVAKAALSDSEEWSKLV